MVLSLDVLLSKQQDLVEEGFMKQRFLKRAVGVALLLRVSGPIAGQSGARNAEWRTYGGDLGNTHYSPLDQINAGKFSKLQVAWWCKTDNLRPRPETNLE